MIAIAAILFTIAGALEAIRGIVETPAKWNASRLYRPGWKYPRWWGHKDETWVNKYRDGVAANGPRFPGSTTFLVALTDLWHTLNLLNWFCLVMAALLAGLVVEDWRGVIIALAASKVVWQVGFSLTLKLVIREKQTYS